jgi:integrase
MARKQRDVPWLEQRDGVWYVHWYNPAERRTRRLSLRTEDAREAQDRYIAFLQEGRAILDDTAGAKLTVREALASYLAEHECAAKERQEYAARHLVACLGDVPISDIDIPASKRYLARRVRDGAAESTVRRELVVLVAAANHAVRWRRLDKVHLPTVDLPPNAPQRPAAFLKKDEIRDLVAAAAESDDPRVKAFIVLAYTTGARRRAIERLRLDQIDMPARRMHLTPEGKRTTKKRAPIVPITDQMASVLRPLMLATRTEYLFGSSGYDGYRAYARLTSALGFDRDGRGHPHILRHSRATHMLQDGASIFEVAKLLGDTVDTVERVYGHHCPDYMSGSAAFATARDVLG